MKNIVFLVLLGWFITGCGGSGSTPPTQTSPLQKGYVVDSPISGLGYECGNITGVTNDKGMFECREFPVTFKIGNLIIGTVSKMPSDKKVYPQDIIGKPRSNFTDAKVVALTRFLQSLDDDGDIDEVIKITPKAVETFSTVQEFSKLDENEVKMLVEDVGKTYVSEEDAMAHLKDNVEKLTSITLTPISSTISLGESVNFTANGSFSNGVKRDITSEAIWSSSKPTVATVSGTKAEAKSIGTTTIKATVDASGTVKAVGLGTAKIKATLGALSHEISVVIVPIGDKPVFITSGDTKKVIGDMRNSINISLGKALIEFDGAFNELYTFEATSNVITGHNLSISGIGVLKFKSPASGDFTITVKATDKKGKASESLTMNFTVVETSIIDKTREVVQTGASDGGTGLAREFTKADQYAHVVGVNGLTWADLDATIPDNVVGESYGAAYDHCAGLTNGGGGWRLPTIDELLDTVNYGKTIDFEDYNGRVYDVVFSTDLLTSWANATANGDKYYLHNQGGTIVPANGNNFRTRCVQGPVQTLEHVVYTDVTGETYDLSTGLKWSKADSNNLITADAGVGYCTDKGWRLPSINELRSVVQNGGISSYITNGQTMLISSTPYNDTDSNTELSWGIYLNLDVTTNVAVMQNSSKYAITCVSPID